MKWRTKSGEDLDIKDMPDNHLSNAIAMLERSIESYPGPQVYIGESYYAENAVEQENRANEDLLEERKEALEIMKKELASRPKGQK